MGEIGSASRLFIIVGLVISCACSASASKGPAPAEPEGAALAGAGGAGATPSEPPITPADHDIEVPPAP